MLGTPSQDPAMTERAPPENLQHPSKPLPVNQLEPDNRSVTTSDGSTGSPAGRRARGRAGWVPTPAPLARELARAALAGEAPGGAPEAPILDPACGTGELLLAALEVLCARGADPLRSAARLHGLELDAERAAETRRRLRAETGDPLPGLEARVRVADALDPAQPWPARALIVANPPWVSFSGRQAGELEPERRALYRASWAAFRAWPSLHGAFLERIAQHVGTGGGRAAVLLPEAVAELEGYGPAREAVERACVLAEAPRRLGEDRFADVTEPAALFVLTERAPGSGGGPGADWTSAPGAGAESDCRAWLVRRFREQPRLPVGSFADPGVHTGNAARELVRRGELGSPPPGWAPVREGRDLAPYVLGRPQAWLRTDLEPVKGVLRFRRAALERYQSFPVLLRQTAARPLAALHDGPTYFRNSLLACRAVPDLDPAFVVAVLNGPAAGAWHRVTAPDARQKSFPQVKVGALATLPFPLVARGSAAADHDAIARLVRELGDAPDPARLHELEERVLALYGLAQDERAVLRRAAAGVTS